MFTQVGTIMALIAALSGAPASDQNVYVRTMCITELNYQTDTVTCTDAVGFVWEFYGVEDYAVGDLVSAMMVDTAGTDTILDDSILDTWYTGYYMDMGGIEECGDR